MLEIQEIQGALGVCGPRIESSSRGQGTKRYHSILLSTLVLFTGSVKRPFISLLCISVCWSACLTMYQSTLSMDGLGEGVLGTHHVQDKSSSRGKQVAECPLCLNQLPDPLYFQALSACLYVKDRNIDPHLATCNHVDQSVCYYFNINCCPKA